MSYLALARKWRPRQFSELLGQPHLVTALTNSLNQQRVHHAYLFTGTRGVGKTSVARLLAKALNCEQGVSSEPCLQCHACVAIEEGRFVDLIEIDAASKTRVEDTRDVLENVQYAATQGRYKIYLIDEVHMLSQHSFNALLKTLEEPPTHVKFLLATTDPQKLPVTVLSRCLQFNLRQVEEQVIQDHLQHILRDESITFDPDVLLLIAKAAAGSMRDALSLLDQAIATCGASLTLEPIKALLGFTQQDYALQILKALSANNPAELMSISQGILQSGGHFAYVTDELLQDFHQLAIYHAIEHPSPLLKLDAALEPFRQQFDKEAIQLMYQIVLKSKEDMVYAPSMVIGFEMMLLRMHAFIPAPAVPVVIQNSSALPLDDRPHVDPTPREIPSNPPTSQEFATKPQDETSRSNEQQSLKNNEELVNKAVEKQVLDHADISWFALLSQLHLSGLTRTAAENAEFKALQENVITLQVEKKHESLFTKPVVKRIEDACTQHFNKKIQVKLDITDKPCNSPALQKKVLDEKTRLNAEMQLEQDGFFKQLQQTFSGEIVKQSIEAIEKTES